MPPVLGQGKRGVRPGDPSAVPPYASPAPGPGVTLCLLWVPGTSAHRTSLCPSASTSPLLAAREETWDLGEGKAEAGKEGKAGRTRSGVSRHAAGGGTGGVYRMRGWEENESWAGGKNEQRPREGLGDLSDIFSEAQTEGRVSFTCGLQMPPLCARRLDPGPWGLSNGSRWSRGQVCCNDPGPEAGHMEGPGDVCGIRGLVQSPEERL